MLADKKRMIHNPRRWLVISVACLLCFAAGVVSGFFLMLSHMEQASAIHAASSASSCLAALRPLRAGDTNRAIDSLELQLGGDLVALVYMQDSVRGEEAKTMAGVLRHIRDYRLEHPYTTGDRMIDAPVQEALRKIEGD
jgi:hypothetical protein